MPERRKAPTVKQLDELVAGWRRTAAMVEDQANLRTVSDYTRAHERGRAAGYRAAMEDLAVLMGTHRTRS